MSSVRTQNGLLFWDFRYKGIRCREYTALPDTPENRKKMSRVLEKVEAEIKGGVFDYRRHFPTSGLAVRFDSVRPVPPSLPGSRANQSPTATTPQSQAIVPADTPLFSAFAETWFAENQIGWRRSYKRTVRDILDKHLYPVFAGTDIGTIRRSDILGYRSRLAALPGLRKGTTLSPARINTVMLILGQVLNEAADRFEFTSPHQRIKPLRIPKSDVQPFTLAEVQQILETVRADFRDYFLVRFLTGMRTGEIDGLKWKYVDFQRRLILIRETVVDGKEDYTKTDSSQRDIQMSQLVFDALQRQFKATGHCSPYVFCNRAGQPLEHNNVTKRVWYPLLRLLGVPLRRPYQARHTAATLWLGSGENPEWIARQLGHSSTQMLFTRYSRFVPNLTRRDGSAFERLVGDELNIVCPPDTAAEKGAQ